MKMLVLKEKAAAKNNAMADKMAEEEKEEVVKMRAAKGKKYISRSLNSLEVTKPTFLLQGGKGGRGQDQGGRGQGGRDQNEGGRGGRKGSANPNAAA